MCCRALPPTAGVRKASGVVAGACAETDTCVPKAAAITAMKQVLVTIVRISPNSKLGLVTPMTKTDGPGRMF